MKKQVYANFNELVFEDRNRFYGAYVLRKQYEDNLLIGLLFGVILVGSVVAIPYIKSMFKSDAVPLSGPTYDPIEIINYPEDDPIVLPPETQAKLPDLPQAITQEFREFVMSNTPSTIVTIDDLAGIDPGATTNLDGVIGGFSLPPTEGTGIDIIGETKTGPVDFVKIEVKPEFPGGDVAMYKFFGEKIAYPERAKQINITGVVYVSFVIDEFGGIRDVSLLRGIGGGCDEEAMRVIQSMPRWKPGKQGGHPVKVRYQLPIKFDLQ